MAQSSRSQPPRTSLARDLLDEVALLGLRGDRARLCAQTVLSVLLAVCLADALGLHDRWWVALTAYTVWRAEPCVLLRRCRERMAGTVAGAVAGVLLATLLFPHPAWRAAAFALVAGAGIYGMLGSPRAYAWILGTVTALMVMSDADGATSPVALAAWRTLDVGVGVGSSLAVACLPFLAARRRGAAAGEAPVGEGVREDGADARRARAAQAAQGAFAIGLLALVDRYQPLPDLPQAIVSVVAVLFVPVAALIHRDGAARVRARMSSRVLGCLGAALVALPLLPLAGGAPLPCQLVLAAGVWLAAHVQAGRASVSYVGTQFGVGFILVFVQDGGWSPDPSGAWARLVGIAIALAGLGLVMAAASLLRRFGLRLIPPRRA
jgi:uncharacterized membrane protein YccC